MDMSTPVLLVCRGVVLVHMLPGVASAKISFTAGISSVCAVSLTVGLLGGCKKETSPMVRPLNNVLSKTSLLVKVTVFGPLLV